MRGVLRFILTVGIWAIACLAVAEDYVGKKVLHIDSYHQGNIWNDSIADAVRKTLQNTGVELKIIHLDTKRNPSEEFQKTAAFEVAHRGVSPRCGYRQ